MGKEKGIVNRKQKPQCYKRVRHSSMKTTQYAYIIISPTAQRAKGFYFEFLILEENLILCATFIAAFLILTRRPIY